jgi:hypothetical protein
VAREQVVKAGPRHGFDPVLLTPQDFRSVPMPGYPEIRVARRERLSPRQADPPHREADRPLGGDVDVSRGGVKAGPRHGFDPVLLTPQDFRSVPMPGYPEIRLSLARCGSSS